MKKALILASVASMIDQFNMPNIEILQQIGYEVSVLANFKFGSTSSQERNIEFCEELRKMNVKVFDIHFERNVFSFNNIKIFRQVQKIIEQGKYDLIHCHSPIGGVITRLAARASRKNGTKIFYTAHGFHFFKGAPLINWLLFYPVERWLARFTDVLITINKEDYERAKIFKAGKVCYIPGVGVDTQKFENIVVNRDAKRLELGVPKEAIMLLSVGELNKNKNHETIIRAIAKLDNISNLYYVICGKGNLDGYLKTLCKQLKISEKVLFFGFRTDIAEILKAADIFVFPSRREGLPVALIEAMAAGLAVVCSNIRGNADLLNNGQGGYLLPNNGVVEFAKAIQEVGTDTEKRLNMGMYNMKMIKNFDVKNVKNLMIEIYIKAMGD